MDRDEIIKRVLKFACYALLVSMTLRCILPEQCIDSVLIITVVATVYFVVLDLYCPLVKICGNKKNTEILENE